jgi:hypothetical protein
VAGLDEALAAAGRYLRPVFWGALRAFGPERRWVGARGVVSLATPSPGADGGL